MVYKTMGLDEVTFGGESRKWKGEMQALNPVAFRGHEEPSEGAEKEQWGWRKTRRVVS